MIIIAADAKLTTIQATAGAADALESQRHLYDTDDHQSDLNIPESMQNFFYNKMSKHIASTIEFVDVDCANNKNRKSKQTKRAATDKFQMKLLKDTLPITHIDEAIVTSEPISMKHAKPSIIRREIEPSEMTDEEKLRAIVVDGESILQKDDTRHWKAKKIRPHKMFNYREKNNKLYLIEPSNEFTAKRKKNNWTESKIAKWKSNN